jgi:hypothetical protein
MTGTDPRAIGGQGVMSVAQALAVPVMDGLNAVDGFSLLSIGLAVPGFTKEWCVDKTTLGSVAPTELLDPALGPGLLGGVAD